MPSTPSTRIRAELQAAGENLNTWGSPKLNAAIQRLEEAKDGRFAKVLTVNYTLAATNYVADEARMAFLDFSGSPVSPCTVTIPGVEKTYLVRNATAGDLIITTGAGIALTLHTGTTSVVASDGTNVVRIGSNADDLAITLAAAATYTNSVAMGSGNLPGSTGMADYVLMSQNAGAGGGAPAFFSPSAARAKLAVNLRNLLINGGFQVNQRAIAASSLTAGVYGFDRWKAGAGGATFTVAVTGADNLITITAGTFVQVVHASSVEGGSYVLSWTGTAQGRLNGGAYGASPLTITGVTAATQITVEFNTGTLTRVNLAPGVNDPGYLRRSYTDELVACQPYFQPLQGVGGGASYPGNKQGTGVLYFTANARSIMQATPVLYQKAALSWSSAAIPSANNISAYDYALSAYLTITGALTLAVINASPSGALLTATAATSFNGSGADSLTLFIGATAVLGLEAEL